MVKLSNLLFWYSLRVVFFIQMGAYHTLDLEMNRKFTLGKQEWDSVSLDRIGNS